jgi:hypothetical protein
MGEDSNVQALEVYQRRGVDQACFTPEAAAALRTGIEGFGVP